MPVQSYDEDSVCSYTRIPYALSIFPFIGIEVKKVDDIRVVEDNINYVSYSYFHILRE